MRSLLISAFIALLCGCGGSGDSSKQFSAKGLKGVWVVSYASRCDNRGEELPQAPRSADDNHPVETYERLSIYSFDGVDRFQCDSGGQNIITGTFSIEDTFLRLKAKAGQKAVSEYWSVLEWGDGMMKVLTDWAGADNHVKYELVKLKEDTSFNIADVSWRQPLDSAATDAQVRNRLKTQLQYYSGYFKTLSDNNIRVFAPGKVICPVALYSGALGIKPFSQCGAWIRNMGSAANAGKAYEMFRNCFKAKFKYPEAKDNFLIEYSIVLAHLAKQL